MQPRLPVLYGTAPHGVHHHQATWKRYHERCQGPPRAMRQTSCPHSTRPHAAARRTGGPARHPPAVPCKPRSTRCHCKRRCPDERGAVTAHGPMQTGALSTHPQLDPLKKSHACMDAGPASTGLHAGSASSAYAMCSGIRGILPTIAEVDCSATVCLLVHNKHVVQQCKYMAMQCWVWLLSMCQQSHALAAHIILSPYGFCEQDISS